MVDVNCATDFVLCIVSGGRLLQHQTFTHQTVKVMKYRWAGHKALVEAAQENLSIARKGNEIMHAHSLVQTAKGVCIQSITFRQVRKSTVVSHIFSHLVLSKIYISRYKVTQSVRNDRKLNATRSHTGDQFMPRCIDFWSWKANIVWLARLYLPYQGLTGIVSQTPSKSRSNMIW